MTATTPTTALTLIRPDDWHLHVRDGDALHTVVPHTAAQFGRAVIMPNLRPPVTTAAQALAYKSRIQAAVPDGVQFEPLMTLYLTDNLAPSEIKRAKDAGVVAAKLYPAGATTNSDAGVTDLRKTYKTLEAMQKEGVLLLVHGEVTSPDIDLFDREAVFIDTQLIAEGNHRAFAFGLESASQSHFFFTASGAATSRRPSPSPWASQTAAAVVRRGPKCVASASMRPSAPRSISPR